MVEATPALEQTPPIEAIREAAAPEQTIAHAATTPLAPASAEPPGAALAVAPKPPPAARPPRRVEIAKDKFADVMALSEAERIALFS
jgi:hypothetical protein